MFVSHFGLKLQMYTKASFFFKLTVVKNYASAPKLKSTRANIRKYGVTSQSFYQNCNENKHRGYTVNYVHEIKRTQVLIQFLHNIRQIPEFNSFLRNFKT